MGIKVRGLFLSKDEQSYHLLKDGLAKHLVDFPHFDLKTPNGILAMCDEKEGGKDYLKGIEIIKETSRNHVLKDTFWLNYYQEPVDLLHYQILLGFPKLGTNEQAVQEYQQQLQDHLKCYILVKEARFGTLFEANIDSYERTHHELTEFLKQNGTGPFQKVKRLAKDGREPFGSFPNEIR